MEFNNKALNRRAQDALICAPNLEQEAPRMYNQVKGWETVYYGGDKHKIQSTFRFMKMYLFLDKVVLFGLGYITLEELKWDYYLWLAEDRRYWNRGDYEAIYPGGYYPTMHPALNHKRLLTAK